MLTNIEFYNTPSGDVMYKEQGEPVKVLSIDSRSIIEYVLQVLADRYPEAFKALSDVYSRFDRNRLNYEFKMVHRFIRCNFGEYDQFNFDIDHCGEWRFEEVRCPLRGECIYECVICKPTLNTCLTDRETDILSMVGDGLKSTQIADQLGISPLTVNRHRQNIMAKLQLKSVGEMIKYAITQLKK